jgi:hypothetical protein
MNPSKMKNNPRKSVASAFIRVLLKQSAVGSRRSAVGGRR